MHDRIVRLEGVHNFRDFGGYRAGEGGVVTRGRLYRSAHLSRATQVDIATIDSLGIRVIADLRRPREREAEPNAWPAEEALGAGARVIAGLRDLDPGLAPHLQFLKDSKAITDESVRAYMVGVYEELAYQEHLVETFRDVFVALREAEGATLIHCAAGKDRTGVLCALVLDALGVAHEDVVADYELTNSAVNIAGVAEQAAVRISERIGRAVTGEEIEPLARVSRDYLDAAWAGIRARSGSLASYRRDVLGVAAEHEAELRARLVTRA